MQRWVRPARRPALPVYSAGQASGAASADPAAAAGADPGADPAAATAAPPRPAGEPSVPVSAPAVPERDIVVAPVHNIIDDEAAVEGVLAWEEAQRRALR